MWPLAWELAWSWMFSVAMQEKCLLLIQIKLHSLLCHMARCCRSRSVFLHQLCINLWPSVLSLTVEHIDSSPYGGVYLSPPLDNNWRRWVTHLLSFAFSLLFSFHLEDWIVSGHFGFFLSSFCSTIADGDEPERVGDELWPSGHSTLPGPWFLFRHFTLKFWASSSCRTVTVSCNILFSSCFSFSSGRFLCVYSERIMALW